jgi:hypothetical protein
MWLAANNHVFGCQQLCGWLPTAMWLAANNNDVVEKKTHVQAKQLSFLEYLRETFYRPSIHKKNGSKMF